MLPRWHLGVASGMPRYATLLLGFKISLKCMAFLARMRGIRFATLCHGTKIAWHGGFSFSPSVACFLFHAIRLNYDLFPFEGR
jgi:hypothetical protein